MKKRLFSLLLAVIMVLGMLPGTVLAADDIIEISSAEALAALGGTSLSSKNYRLTADIDMSGQVMAPIKSLYNGTFDGGGHTISNLAITSSGNTGLFAELSSNATVTGVILKDCTIENTYSSSYGVGALVGKISGSNAVISNCGVLGGSVSSSSSSTAYIGGLIGYVYGDTTISNCFSTATVTGNNSYSSCAGGLVGRTYAETAISDCYTRGTVSSNYSSSSNVGGLIGYAYVSYSSSSVTVTNCYTAASVEKGYPVAYVSGSNIAFENCYYDSVQSAGNQDNTQSGITAKTTEELKGLAADLGGTFQDDLASPVNEGYPILKWQDPNATYSVTLRVEPANAVVTWNSQAQPANETGVYTFEGLTSGTSCEYTVEQGSEDEDYAPQSGTITVGKANVERTITLEPNRYDLTFNLTPADAELTVTDSESASLTPTSGTTYSVVNGTYHYAAEAFGYDSITDGSATVNKATETVNVELQAQPVVTATFTYDALIGGVDVKSGSLEVKTGDRVIEAEENTDGLVYKLPVGYDYTWTFKSANYAKQTGDINLGTETGAGAQTVTIPLTEKTAWEGGNDIIAPPQTDGVYQISSGAELAWLAQEVNAGRGAEYDAVLIQDIDLGDENWTPIGKAYSTRYAGTFDGQGFTISGLNISGSSSANYGLFGYVEGGTVRNLTVDGKIAVTGSGSSSYGIAGIVGQFNGTTGAVENCVNKATVNGSQNVGGVIGYISGGYGATTKAVRNCANLSNISSTGAKAGGVIGYVYGPVTVENCYNTGNIIGGGWYHGGITAYLSNQDALIKNCYSTGTVTGSGSAAVIGKKDKGSVENLYYLSTAGTDANATAKTETEMKSADFVLALGAAFQKDMAEPINGGYPILTFQDTTPKYEVTITAVPADALVTVKNASAETMPPVSSADGTTTYRLPDGTYTYSVSTFGYDPVDGTVTVNGGAVTETVTLTAAAKQTVTFQVTPAAAADLAKITVTYDGDDRTIEAEGDGSYLLPTGDYHYTVKAKGYAKVVDAFSVDGSAESPQAISVVLQESTQWDGESQEEVTLNGEGVYEIGSGAELAWFAAQVNSGTGTAYDALLTDDIDLGENPWTPIGNTSSKYYSGTFDGGGYTVSGLNVSGAEFAGLFGYVKGAAAQNAELKNMVVQGSVDGQYAGGIVGRADYVAIQNCGNEAAVTGSGYAGGVVGQKFNYSSTLTIDGCYNTAAVSGDDRTGGILGSVSGSADVRCCYNTGSVTAGNSGYAGGIRASSGSLSGATEYCYNTGTISGKYTGPILSDSGSVTNCFYLGDEITGAAGTPKTSDELKNLTAALNGDADPAVWKSVSSMNDGYPVLAWQKAEGGSGGTGSALNKATNAVWRADEDTGLLTGVATWDTVPNAESYTVVLWETHTEEEENVTTNELRAIETVNNVTETQYDFTAEIEANGPSWYYFTVTPIAAEGSEYESGKVPANEAEAYDLIDLYNDDSCYRYTAQLDAPGGLHWRGHMAQWEFVDDAAGYLVMLYRLNEDGEANYIAGGVVSGAVNTLDCRNYFAVGGQYVFSVLALSEEYLITGSEEKNSPESKLSNDPDNGGTDYGVYTAEPAPDPEPGDGDRTDWVAISTAEEWMALANVEDLPSKDDPQTSQQAIEWGKKYYLTADLDFSGLSASDQARTKSIGNVTNRFAGILDGNGHKITGLTLSNYDSGLFAYIGASGLVHDLTVEGANVLFSDNAAVLALNNYGTIQSCAVVNCNITADTGAVLGGMVSRNYGNIRESYVQGGTLTSNSQTATGHAGFVGSNESGTIERCWTSMEVNTQSEYAGGFVGLGYGGIIRNCFSLGDVTARSYSGGFAGRSVYSGNTYENCYAAGTVTVSGEGGHGFIGGSAPDSAFQPDLSQEVHNCYYNAASPADPHAEGKTLAEMRDSAFLIKLGSTGGVWTQAAEKNGGLPYLADVAVPEELPTDSITVEIALATYDKDAYSFSQMGETISVTVESNGNTRVIDAMDAAVDQGLLTYSYDTTPTFGRYIHTINGYAVEAPDGWMFTIDDALSNVSASLATVTDGDKLLWFEGTTENHFLPPSWDSLAGGEIQWEDIDSLEALQALAGSTDAGVLGKHYRLTTDLNLEGVTFAGIGTANAPFTGVFDGQGYTISNVKMDSGTENTGFFGVIKGATIKNLNLKAVDIKGGKNVGGLVGWAQVQLDQNDMAGCVANLVGNCTVSGSVTGGSNMGGLVGLNDGAYDKNTLFSIASAIDKCTADVAVTAAGDSSANIGGLAGKNNGVITKSAAAGTVSAASSTTVGGFVGDNYGDVYDSHAEGSVTGKGHVGGFAGSSSGTVKNCYSLGSVSGQEYTGGFAGSISAAENVISAGQVTITGNSSTGYNGGFAGQLNGTLTGVANQITVKNAYSNCTQAAGAPSGVVGNSVDFSGEAAAILGQMGLATTKEVSAKLYEMFGVNLPVSDGLKSEADKYADAVTARQTVSGDQISLLLPDATADGEITVGYEVESAYLTGGSTLTLAKANDTTATLSVPVVLTLTDAGGNVYRKTAAVLLPVQADKMENLMDTIAASYVDNSDGWTVLDMVAYGALDGKTSATSDGAWQNALNLLITEAEGETASVSDRARIEIVLRAMGVDSARLYGANSSTSFSNAKKLAGMDLTTGGYYAAPWILLADLQGNLKLTDSQTAALIQLLADNIGDGLFGYTWEGVTYADPDTAGAALAALAKYYDTNDNARVVVDQILAALPGAQDEKGSLGGANSDAMVILGLLALGRDPADFTAATGASLVDGLLSYVNVSTNQFQFFGADNALATEQGFRALVAMAKAADGAYNVYDFSANAVEPGRATGSGQITPPSEPETGKNIQVTFTLKTDTSLWIPTMTLTVKEGSVVYHAFDKALDAAGDMSAVGAERGYVKSITKNGVTLGEFDKGENSGWLYTVNGELPRVGLTAYPLKDGDDILFYYTTDWKDDPNAGGSFEKPGQKDLPFTDVEGHWALEAIAYSYTHDLMNGISADKFYPESSLNRAMLATILYRLAGEPDSKAENVYSDVADTAWYTEAVLWASEAGVVTGYGDGTFGPEDNITREQMAAMLYRYAAYQKYDVTATSDLQGFSDAGSISAWALEALEWAHAEQLINGRSTTTIVPGGSATRAEAATILMRFCKHVAK